MPFLVLRKRVIVFEMLKTFFQSFLFPVVGMVLSLLTLYLALLMRKVVLQNLHLLLIDQNELDCVLYNFILNHCHNKLKEEIHKF